MRVCQSILHLSKIYIYFSHAIVYVGINQRSVGISVAALYLVPAVLRESGMLCEPVLVEFCAGLTTCSTLTSGSPENASAGLSRGTAVHTCAIIIYIPAVSVHCYFFLLAAEKYIESCCCYGCDTQRFKYSYAREYSPVAVNFMSNECQRYITRPTNPYQTVLPSLFLLLTLKK